MAAPRSILAPVLVSIGLLVAAWLVTVRGRGLRFLAPVVLAVVVAVPAWMVHPLGYRATESRATASRTCSGTQPQVCLWPERHDVAEDVTAWATDAHSRLTAVGVTTAAQLSPRSSTPTSDDVRALLALSALPKDVPACARTGEWPGSRAYGPLSVRLAVTAGANPDVVESRYAPAEVEVAKRVLERSRQDQRPWFQQNAAGRTSSSTSVRPTTGPAARRT